MSSDDWKKMVGDWPVPRAATGSFTTRQNQGQSQSLAIRQWTFHPEQ
jgi:hypothetical protein